MARAKKLKYGGAKSRAALQKERTILFAIEAIEAARKMNLSKWRKMCIRFGLLPDTKMSGVDADGLIWTDQQCESAIHRFRIKHLSHFKKKQIASSLIFIRQHHGGQLPRGMQWLDDEQTRISYDDYKEPPISKVAL